MMVEVLDVEVEATKVQEKTKSFKDMVVGGRKKLLEDVSMEGTVNNMPIYDQLAIGACTSSKANKKL